MITFNLLKFPFLGLAFGLLTFFGLNNSFAQIPNPSFENWTCSKPFTYPAPPLINSISNQYLDSLVSGTFKLHFYKFFTPDGDALFDFCAVYPSDASLVDSISVNLFDTCSTQVAQSTSLQSPIYGNDLRTGIYLRRIFCKLSSGVELVKNDSVQLIKPGYPNVSGCSEPVLWRTDVYALENGNCRIRRDLDHFPAFSGNYSMRIEKALAVADNVVLPAEQSLTGYYRYLPENPDTLTIIIAYITNEHSNGNFDFFKTSDVAQNWTQFILPMTNRGSSDSAFIGFSTFNFSNPNPPKNSILYVDNLNFENITSRTDLQRTSPALVNIYPNPGTVIVNINSSIPIQQVNLEDVLGKEIPINLLPQNKIDIRNLKSGMYRVKVQTNDGVSVQKLIKL